MKVKITRYFGRSTISGIRSKMINDTTVVNHKIMRKRVPKSEFIINWGSSANKVADYYLNKKMSVSSSKLAARIMLEANGIRVPKTFGAGYVFVPDEDFFPLVGRPIRHHSGNDYHIINSLQDLEENLHICEYFSKIIPKKKEFRVHVALGKVLILQEKKPGEDVSPLSPWNWANGSKFETIKWSDYKLYKDAIKQASDSVFHLGLDWGAVDVILGEDDKYYVLEVNTSPSLEDYAQKRYAKFFDEVIDFVKDNGYKPEYIKFSNEEKMKKYWFKNNSKNF